MTRLGGLGLSLLLIAFPTSASVLSELAKTVQPGTFVELEIDGDVSTCRAVTPPMPPQQYDKEGKPIPLPRPEDLGNILEFTDEAHWDSKNKEIYIAGTRRPYKPWDQAFVKYSEATNSWTILKSPPFGFGAHGYDNGALDVARGTFYWSRVAEANNVWSLNLETSEWIELPNAPIAAGEQSALEYFPDIDKVVFFDARAEHASMYALYDPETNKWGSPVEISFDEIGPFGEISHFSEYNPNHGVMFFGGGHNYTADGTINPTPNIDESRRLYMLDKNKVVSRLVDAPTKLGQQGAGPIQTIDPNSGNLVVFQGQPNDGSSPCPDPLPIWEYNLGSNSWSQTGEQKLFGRWCSMDTVAVPLPEYGINFIVSAKSVTDCKVYLYRHSDGTGELKINAQPTAVTVVQGQVAKFSVVAFGSSPINYQWRKDGENINGATTASYSFTALDMTDNGAIFDVVVSNTTESITSSGATLTIIEDTTAPTLESVFATSDTGVDVVFSEGVSTSSAENSANYQIDPVIAVTAASLSNDGRTVSLTVSSLTEDTSYSLQVSHVQDLAQTPNTILAQSSQDFIYLIADGFEDGNADGWTPLNAANWDVAVDEGDLAYCINTTDVSPIEGNRLGEYALLPSSYADFSLTAEARLVDNVTSNDLADYAMIFGFQDPENYYYVMFNNAQNATQLFKVVGGARSAVSDLASSDWLNDNAYHSVKVSRVGNDIKVYFDDNLILSASDGTLGAGQVGVGSYNDAACFDEVSVTGVSSTLPDDIAPVITLSGVNPQTLTVGTTYTELGASATDNVDGNLSGNITIDASAVNTNTVGNYSVTYNVSDTAGNAATEKIRTVQVTDEADTVAPVITLSGTNPQTLTVGMTYTELGASATDNVDGNLSGNITIDASAVDTNTVGNYSVTYNVSDTAGNAAVEVSRTVQVTAATVNPPGDSSGGGSLGWWMLVLMLVFRMVKIFKRESYTQ